MAKGRWIGGILAAALVLGLVWLLVYRRQPARVAAPAKTSTRDAAAKPTAEAPARPVVQAASPHPGPAGAIHLEARWGKGAAELGHKLGEEAPEGPMSLAVGRKGDLWVLDQVNSRIQHFDATGKLAGSIPVAETTQDLAIGPRGELYTLDRLGKSEVVAYDAAGRALARDAVVGGPIDEGGAVTGLFVDEDGVYLEREHTDSVKIGGGDGQFDAERPVAPGRPSRDGSAFLRAAIGRRGSPVVTVTVFGKDGTQRWQKPLAFPHGVLHLLLLDTDRRGHLFVGAEVADESPGPPHGLVNLEVVVLRLGLADGAAMGALELAASTRPEEILRELTVTDDGDVVQMLALDDGVRIASFRFP